MPLYEYRCPDCDRIDERLRRYEDRDSKANCPTCGGRAERIISAHHRQPDGIYSYAPNLGNPADFERKWEDANQRAEKTGTYKPGAKRGKAS